MSPARHCKNQSQANRISGNKILWCDPQVHSVCVQLYQCGVNHHSSQASPNMIGNQHQVLSFCLQASHSQFGWNMQNKPADMSMLICFSNKCIFLKDSFRLKLKGTRQKKKSWQSWENSGHEFSTKIQHVETHRIQFNQYLVENIYL